MSLVDPAHAPRPPSAASRITGTVGITSGVALLVWFGFVVSNINEGSQSIWATIFIFAFSLLIVAIFGVMPAYLGWKLIRAPRASDVKMLLGLEILILAVIIASRFDAYPSDEFRRGGPLLIEMLVGGLLYLYLVRLLLPKMGFERPRFGDLISKTYCGILAFQIFGITPVLLERYDLLATRPFVEAVTPVLVGIGSYLLMTLPCRLSSKDPAPSSPPQET